MPRLFIVTGLPYAGKSVLSRELVRRLGCGYASVDSEITAGDYDVTTMSQQDWNDVYARAYDRLEGLLRSGVSVVFDGASLARHNRRTLRKIAADCGAEAVLVYVNTSPAETAQRRLRNLSTRERAHLADETVRLAMSQFEEPGADEEPVVYHAGMDLEEWFADIGNGSPPRLS
jgi:predicted kinase